ncbi:MAG TPA: 4-alpha-glucanotransferase [Verrucomicrobiae bacterium]|nr:4-alpha-glucanotransferase [Verrucomicrobiae bacterium]
MRLTFQLRFYTHPGQSLFITGNHPLLGGDEITRAIPLEYVDEQFWRVTLDFPGEQSGEITYRYILRQPDGTIFEDWGNGRTVNPGASKKAELLIVDAWNPPGLVENAFYTEPFRAVLLREWATTFTSSPPPVVTHRFKIKAPLLQKGQTLCLLGETDALSRWDTAHPVLMNRYENSDWLAADLDLTGTQFPVAYKYGVYDIDAQKFVRYEEGPNRTLFDRIVLEKQTVVNDGFVRLPHENWHGAGVAIPVFSLRTRRSFGVGEFTDLKMLADWCQAAGLKLIQILPVNDTTSTHTCADSYPYAAISAFALHPLYLNLEQVATKTYRALLEAVEEERRQLNGLKDLDYETVMNRKLQLLRELYQSQRDQVFKQSDYLRFFKSNEHWLVPYAVFCHLRDQNGTADFRRWKNHSVYNSEAVAALAGESSPAWEDVAFHFFVQYHLHLQLQEATEYAHSKGVILKGDIAIGVSRFGSDAWQQPDLYRMEMQAGAPPDAFGIKGQNWSFPTYNWPKLKETGFAWWKQRFAQMGAYFDAFRIDHILGFFRIWSIPIHAVEGIMGSFVPAIPVSAREFTSRGILFDRERFTQPFITDTLLREIFGEEDAEYVWKTFLKSDRPGSYKLRPEFATQRQVERYFQGLEQSPRHARLQEGLFDLISNVILFEDEQNPSENFHFRFSMETTGSFRNLDAETQHHLKELYLDYFFRRQDDFWMKEAMQKLPALKRVTNMLICGEDLGMVPACVPEAMKQLGLLALEVQRMPKRLNHKFSNPAHAVYLSVVTPSTHDMSTIRGWWTEDRAVTQRFYNQALGQPGIAPSECEPWINRAIVNQHLASPAMWSIFQLQDLLGMDPSLRRPNPAEDRINVPADAKNYWRYRMHLFIEDLLGATAFNYELRQDLAKSGR